ncbi:MAG: segregation and condensation protein A [Thiohalomonadales bacterium]
MKTTKEGYDELRALRMFKQVLTDIAKDTFTQAGLRHPLKDNTIMGIRDCLALITSRESELADPAASVSKPSFIDEKPNKVVVSLQPKKPKN